MTPNEAKAILRGTPPRSTREDDPRLLEAMSLLEKDTTLQEWYTRECAFDHAVSQRLNEIEPPDHLRARILATQPLRQARHRWLIPSLAMAAALFPIAGLIYAVLPTIRARALPEELAEFALHDAIHGDHHPGGALVRTIQASLGDPQRSLLQSLPATLPELQADGCRTFDFAGHEVAEICFSRDGVEMHLYVMDARRIGAVPPTFVEKDGNTAVTWSDGRYLYSLFGDMPRNAFSRVL